VNLAVIEARRALLRFGLLTGAVSLLVFLVLLLSTLSSALVRSFTGAVAGLDADVLAYAANARDNIQASRLAPEVVAAVAAVPGVAAASAIATLTATGQVAGKQADLQVFGFTPGEPGQPTGLASGRLPQAADETAIDGGGAAIGDTVVIQPGEVSLTVVGTLRGAQFAASPTAYVDLDTYEELVRAANPNAPFVPVNAVAVTVESGADPAQVAAAITADVPDLTGYTRDVAVSRIPGVESVSQTFGILVGLTFVIGIVVIGFFFLILTVQKLKAFTLLRAIGASTGRLAVTVSTQIAIVVLAASAVAVVLTLLAVRGLDTGIPVSLSPTLVIATVLSVLVFSLLAGLLSVRRIARIDPFSAAGAR
jgi:putative ABC transport system permease protein